MAKKKYPRIGWFWKLNKPKGLCKICGEPKADTRIDVEHSCMRGDDDTHHVHWSCREGKTEEELLEVLNG